MIISCDYSIRKFADAKDLTETLVLKNKANDENCAAALAVSGRQLSSLDLSRCHLLTTSFFTNNIPRCPNLKYLDLSYTSINNIEPIVTTCSVLQGLNLSGTQRLLNYNPISELTTLQCLSLRNSYITDIDCLSPLVLLRSLDLGGTAINNISPLKHCTRLEELLLDHSSGENMKNHLRWETIIKKITKKIIKTSESQSDNGVNSLQVSRNNSEDRDDMETDSNSNSDTDSNSNSSVYEEIEIEEEYSIPLNKSNGTDDTYVVQNINLLKHLTLKEDANLRLLNISEMELGLGWLDQIVDMLHEDVCIEKNCKKMQMITAIVNNDYDTCRRLLNSGLYLHERIGPWAKHYLASIWHSPRCGAEVETEQYKLEKLKIDTNIELDHGFDPPELKNRPVGCIPFFNVCHEVETLRPTYLHLALLFCSVEVVEVLMLMNIDPGLSVWMGEVIFDEDDNAMEKLKITSPSKRIQGIASPLAKKEKTTIFGDAVALVEEINLRTVHRYVRGMVEQNISNFKKLCNYYCESLICILQGDYRPLETAPEIRYQSGSGGGVGDKPIADVIEMKSSISNDNRPRTTGIGVASTSTSRSRVEENGINPKNVGTPNKTLNSNSLKLSSTSASSFRMQDDAASIATSTSDWTAMVGITLEGDESVYNSVTEGSHCMDDNQSVVTNATENSINSSTIRTNAIQNINTSPIAITLKASNSQVDIGEEASIDSVDKMITPMKLKKKNNLITRRVDVSELQSRYSSLCWRKHDMVLKLTGPLGPLPEFYLAEDYQMANKISNYEGPFYFTSKISLGFQQYRATKSNKIIHVLGYKNYFLTHNKVAIHEDIKKKEIKWESDLKERIENVRIYDTKLGFQRVIKTATLSNVPSDMNRKQELIDSIKEKSGDRW